MTRLSVRGVELSYELQGEGWPTLIWGHGLSGSQEHDDALGLIDFGGLGTCRLLRYDARGHGNSEVAGDPEDYSWASLAFDQLALADAVGIDHFVAGGASMGCGTALHTAVTAPARVRGLLLVIPPTGWELRREKVAMWAELADAVERDGVDAFVDGLLALPTPDPLAADATWERSLDVQRKMDVRQLATVLRGAGTADLPARDLVASIAVPALILAWTGDPGHPASVAEELARLLPGAELQLASTRDDLDRWTDHAAAFLARTEP